MGSYVRYYRVAVVFAIIGVFFLSGCQETSKSKVSEPVESGTIIIADCIADYHLPDGSRYVSEQSHKIELENRNLGVMASEPAGQFEYLLKDKIFTIQQHSVLPAPLPVTICDENMANGLLGLYIANIADIGPSFSAAVDSPVKIEGRWYQPLAGDEGVTFCKNLDTGIVDTVWLVGTNETYLTIIGYHYKKLKTTVGMVPAKIEIFETDAGKQHREPLVRYSGVISEISN
jgi:hypothetical protein